MVALRIISTLNFVEISELHNAVKYKIYCQKFWQRVCKILKNIILNFS
jgi:hypothetical protein